MGDDKPENSSVRGRAGWWLEPLYSPPIPGFAVLLAALFYIAVTRLTGPSSSAPSPEASPAIDALLPALFTAFVVMAAGLVYLTWRGRRL